MTDYHQLSLKAYEAFANASLEERLSIIRQAGIIDENNNLTEHYVDPPVEPEDIFSRADEIAARMDAGEPAQISDETRSATERSLDVKPIAVDLWADRLAKDLADLAEDEPHG